MKKIRKIVTWNDGCKQEIYHESFSSYQDFYDTLNQREEKTRALKMVFDDHSTSWMGVKSIDEAKNYLLNGWEKPLEQIKKKTASKLHNLEMMPKRKIFNDVVGYQPIVANALMGLPKSMINVRNELVGSRIIRFLIMIDRAACEDAETIVERMSNQLAHIAALERTGKYRCRIEVSFVAFGGRSRSGMINTSASVLVKSEHQLFDVRRLCFPIVHPAMLRLLMFAWNEGLPLDKCKYHESGYGCSFEHWNSGQKDAFRKSITENNEKVLVVDLHTDMDTLLKDF